MPKPKKIPTVWRTLDRADTLLFEVAERLRELAQNADERSDTFVAEGYEGLAGRVDELRDSLRTSVMDDTPKSVKMSYPITGV